MSKVLCVVLALLLCIQTIDARPKKKTSGSIKNSIFTDSKYGYCMNFPSNWKAKIQYKDSDCRLVLRQQEHKIPKKFERKPWVANVPRSEIWIVDVPYEPQAFLDSLLSSTYKTDLKSKMLKGVWLTLSQESFVGFKTLHMGTPEILNRKAVLWRGLAQHKLGREGTKTKVSKGSGGIILNIGSQLLVVLVGSEEEYSDEIFEQILTMVRSIDCLD